MKPEIKPRRAETILATMAAIGAALLFLTLDTPSLPQEQEFPAGSIELTILNSACAAVSPQFSPDPSNLNDGTLDERELAAIYEGCTIQAIAIAPNGMRLTDIPLLLMRSEAGSDQIERTEGGPFQGIRSTDDYGAATWNFRLSPHTDFFYAVVSPSPTQRTVWSNTVEIQLCTGLESLNAFRRDSLIDAGRGCSGR